MGFMQRLRRRTGEDTSPAVKSAKPAVPAAAAAASADWKELLMQHFDVLDVLGRGGYSTVFRARRLADGRHYALKVTDLDRLTDWSRRAAVREAHVLAALAGPRAACLPHPCLATFREAFCLGSRLCIVTDAAPGGDLKQLLGQRLSAQSALGEAEVWRILLQVALALQHLHAHRVLHRDVKPANVLLSSNGLVQLTDLGICGQLSGVFTRKEAGTPQYKAPEMWRGQPYSFSSDIWALGCLLYEMCTGRPLFDAPPGCTDPEAAVAAVRQQVLEFGCPPPLPSCYSPQLSAVLAALLQPSPAQRPCAAELLCMPGVAGRLRELPAEVQACLAAAGRQQPQPLATTSIQGEKLTCSPTKLQSFTPTAVNACLPPAAYPGDSTGLLSSPSPQQPAQQRRRLSLFSQRGRQSTQDVPAPVGGSSRDSSGGSAGDHVDDLCSSTSSISSMSSSTSTGVASLASLDLATLPSQPESPLCGRLGSSRSPRTPAFCALEAGNVGVTEDALQGLCRTSCPHVLFVSATTVA